MLDWLFAMLLVMAILFLMLSIFMPEKETYWRIMFCVLSMTVWFLLAFYNLDIETAYPCYNSTTGNTTLVFNTYLDDKAIYLTYVFSMIGLLCIIYLLILIFGEYYEYMDKKNKKIDEENSD